MAKPARSNTAITTTFFISSGFYSKDVPILAVQLLFLFGWFYFSLVKLNIGWAAVLLTATQNYAQAKNDKQKSFHCSSRTTK
jgi:hypothetical protein